MNEKISKIQSLEKNNAELIIQNEQYRLTLLSKSKQQNDIAADKADLNELSIELRRREEALKRQQLDHQRQVIEWEKQHSEEKSSLEKSRE